MSSNGCSFTWDDEAYGGRSASLQACPGFIREQMLSAGAAAQNIMVAANALGYESAWNR